MIRGSASRWNSVLNIAVKLVLVLAGITFIAANWSHLFPPGADANLPREPVPLTGAAIIGNPRAKVAILEYSDFECPYCERFATNTLPELKKTYIDPGRVQLAFREFPLERIHRVAFAAAEIAECASVVGTFEQTHNLLFGHQKDIKATLQLPGILPVTVAQDADCRNRNLASKIRDDVKSGRDLGVVSTPTFFLGTIASDGRLRITQRIKGAAPMAQFANSLDNLLGPREASQTSPRTVGAVAVLGAALVGVLIPLFRRP